MECTTAPFLTFNPSLVRLALLRLLETAHTVTAFNPSLVRLAHETLSPVDDAGHRIFQSQLGSIGAPASSPKMVAVIRFQSQLGSIGAA